MPRFKGELITGNANRRRHCEEGKQREQAFMTWQSPLALHKFMRFFGLPITIGIPLNDAKIFTSLRHWEREIKRYKSKK